MTLQTLLGIELPIIQAPMAGAQDGRLAVAVSNAGGLGSLPCAMLDLAAMRNELAYVAAHTSRPYNVNFSCHTPARATADRESAWRAVLAPYYRECQLEMAAAASAAVSRAPFSAEAADLIGEFKPAVVSFYFGLPSAELVARVKAGGSKIFASATTVDEARWLEAHGVNAIVAQGFEAGGHRAMFLADDLTTQVGTFALLP